MPQDSLRSVYRSFLTCHDPKGVVECKKIRKSSSRKDVDDHRKEEENRNISSDYIAKDLLKGALDLEESLIMLGKLQEEASEFKIRHKGGRDDSWDCYDELREVIRESFARQNLLIANQKEKEKEKDIGGLDYYCMDLPSTSSSHSPSPSTWFQSSDVEHGKPKAPNLIAKLMGLEETPRKAMSSSIVSKKEKFSNQVLDIDLAKPWKPRIVLQREKTLEEMIETMQFKGLLDRRIDGSDCCRGCSDNFISRKSLDFDDPPIVLMRPLRVPDRQIPKYHCNCTEMPGKRMKEFWPSVIPGPNGKLQSGRTLQQKIDKRKESKQSVEPSARLIKKTPDSANNLSSMKVSHRKPLVTKVQKSGVSSKKIDSVAKMASNTKKPSEMKGVISQESTKPSDLGNTTYKLGKAARVPNVSKEHVARSKNILEVNMNPRSVTPSIPKKNLQKDKSEIKLSINFGKNVTSCDNMQATIESHILEPLNSTTPQNCTNEMADTTYGLISDYTGDASSSSHGTTVMDNVTCIEDCGCSPCPPASDDNRGCKSVVDAKDLLLSSVSFLNHAKELFDTRPHDALCMLTARLPDCELLDASLLVKCGEELLHRKCQEHAIPRNLFRSPKRYSSLEQLAGEISAEIEELRNLSKSSGEIVLSDSIYLILERDLCGKGEATSPWDSGWKSGVAVGGVNEVMDDVEKLVLCELVDDLVMQLSSSPNLL